MNNSSLQDQIYRGMGTAARAIGISCNAFRPTSPAEPLAPENRFLQLDVAFNAQDNTFRRAGLASQAAWYCICDSAYLKPGDYLSEVLSNRIWFIGAIQPLLPVVSILTNRTVSISRPAGYNLPGLNAYGGGETSSPIASNFPVSLLHGGDLRGPATIPSDARLGGAIMLFPPLSGMELYRGDIVNDDIGRSFIVGQAEQNSLGWHAELKQAAT